MSGRPPPALVRLHQLAAAASADIGTAVLTDTATDTGTAGPAGADRDTEAGAAGPAGTDRDTDTDTAVGAVGGAGATDGDAPGGLAIDLAGGDGAGALWLALLGFSPVLVEVSDVALLLAEQAANERGVDLVTSRVDLTDETIASVVHRIGGDPGTEAVAAQPVALIGCFHYLNRRLLASVAAGLPAGAMFLASIATMTNLERNERPSARFLLQPGELRSLVVDGVESAPETGLDVIHDAEGWTPEGTHEATIIVSRSPLK